MIQTVLVIFWNVLATLFFCILVIIVSLLDNGGELPHKFARLWARSVLFASRVNVTVKNNSKIDPAGPYIYMCNHQSNFDIPVLLAYLPVQFKWLAKAELFRIPVFGYAMKRAGYISIDRSNLTSAKLSFKRAARIISRGVSVIIFPEGTRSLYGEIGPFKKGGFVLAVESGVPIVPVIIHGTWPIMPKNRLFINPGNVVLEIGTPIESSKYDRNTKDDLMNRTREVICGSFEKGKRWK
jgi:1-acyl-sn-glycerol-3-phosphate acyltransferase